MQKHFFILLAMFCLVTVASPTLALADIFVKIVVTWDEHCAPYDIQGTAQLLDGNDDPIGNPIQLDGDLDLVTFSGTFQNPPSSAVSVLFDWQVDWGYQFNPAPTQTVPINWSGTTGLPTSATCNGR